MSIGTRLDDAITDTLSVLAGLADRVLAAIAVADTPPPCACSSSSPGPNHPAFKALHHTNIQTVTQALTGHIPDESPDGEVQCGSDLSACGMWFPDWPGWREHAAELIIEAFTTQPA